MSDETKAIAFRGSSLADLRAFPIAARREAGFQLDRIQQGLDPSDWKPMTSIGAGCREIRIRDADGAFRVIYVAKFESAVFVVHCFRKEDAEDQPAGPDPGNKTLSGACEGDRHVTEQKFDSVWDAIEDSPAEAENMRVRSTLMMALQERIKSSGMTQAEAARRFGVTQPRISDLMRGKIDVFGIDALVNMLATAGLHVELTVAEAA